MSNLSSRLAGRKMPHKDVPICLDLDLLALRDDAMAALDGAARTARAKQAQDDRMVQREDKAVVEARQRVEDLDAQIRDASIVLRVYGVDRHTYNQWIVDCPPAKGTTLPFDPSRFYLHAAKNSAKYVDENGVEHEIDDEDWAELDKMTNGEHDRIAKAVVHVNMSAGQVDVGFFVNGSETTRDSFGISGSRGASESHPAGSGVGKPKKSTSKK